MKALNSMPILRLALVAVLAGVPTAQAQDRYSNLETSPVRSTPPPERTTTDQVRSPRDPATDPTPPQAQAGYFTNVMVTSVVAPKPEAQTAQSESSTSAEGRSMSFERNADGSRQGGPESRPSNWYVPELDSDQSAMVRNPGSGGQSATQSSGMLEGKQPSANLPEVGDEVLVSLANGSRSVNPGVSQRDDTKPTDSMSLNIVNTPLMDAASNSADSTQSGAKSMGARGARQDIEVENDETHVVAHGSGRTGSGPTAGYIGETEKNIDQVGVGPSDKFVGGSDDGQSIRKKQPRRDRNGTRAKRQHKP